MAGMRQIIAQHRNVFTPSLYARLRTVWFGDLPWGARLADQACVERWFTAGPEAKARFDKLCDDEFGAAVRALSPANYPVKGLSDADIAAPFVEEIYGPGGVDEVGRVKTALSMMILLDQIPRNLYRSKETLRIVYEHYDRIALSLARHVSTATPRLDLHPSIRLSQPFRQWFYLPLMHSEDLEDHRLFSRILEGLAEEGRDDPDVVKSVEDSIKFEKLHVAILERFGRYPHRNACLGRDFTDEERKWLDEGGQRFGVAS
ncbi:uncharacterized protein PV09_04414 [Verruconis gallopava]|uniref:DUF924-domain-containing protein n=1 Tax=Verruconis gallopava TaxID=253628 RepID=A0A0D2ACP6_9PEZI|nr:uncharacterized protein PV09_04414 [Verruconis gallopava]KIW04678.1 hypothetical protein PV09_04414 [Verruconis gallopava]